jgi:flavin reductase (DIM6/NTAB) family NADH-FMN oxidoreductase RutF
MDRTTLRRVLSLVPYGISVVTAREAGRHVSMLATWVTQVSFHPPLVALATENDSHMLRAIRSAGFFAVNFLPEGGKKIASSFLKPAAVGEGAVASHPFTVAPNGSSFLNEAAGSVECRVTALHPAGDHTLVVGEVCEAVARGESAPLLLSATGWKYQK